MSAPIEGTAAVPARALSDTRSTSARGRWIEHWEPENEAFWESTGKSIARKNLIFSIFAEHIGFSIWVLWTIIVINLANIGITMSISELFLLVAVPNLVGSALRIPYTFAVPKFGGRAWTASSSAGITSSDALIAVQARPPNLGTANV